MSSSASHCAALGREGKGGQASLVKHPVQPYGCPRAIDVPQHPVVWLARLERAVYRQLLRRPLEDEVDQLLQNPKHDRGNLAIAVCALMVWAHAGLLAVSKVVPDYQNGSTQAVQSA
jgi:hypothetical protein